MIDEGWHASVSDIARVEKIDRTYVGDILLLTLLAPDIAEAILWGEQAAAVTLTEVMRSRVAKRNDVKTMQTRSSNDGAGR
jgi:hypothetical protein